MLRSEVKASILLFIFSLLLNEYLNVSTIAFVFFGAAVLYFQIKVPKMIRSVGVVLLFISYWFTYGKVIDPEVGLNFLTSVIVVKLLEKETVRDRYMIFFGMILLLSAGALFEKTLTYAIFYGASFIFLLHDFYSELRIKWRPKDLGLAFLWVIPLTIILFFVFPRLLNPLPFGKSGPGEGEVGFTPDVNISLIDKLAPNDEPVFQALVEKEISQQKLYWRGNTLIQSDGWNWTRSYANGKIHSKSPNENFVGIKQEIRLLTKEEYFFTLDHPLAVVYGEKVHEPNEMTSISQRTWQWTPNYTAYSDADSNFKALIPGKENLQVILSQKDRVWIKDTFPGTTLNEVRTEVRKYFDKEKFIYSLSPGRILSFRSFMHERKIGFCSHYASALAIILRVKGFPTRLVSGFMGGNFNRFADYYLVTQNDAHVWVESYESGAWSKLDPTEWIAPDRVRLGGDAFMAASSTNVFRGMVGKLNVKWINDAKLWFKQWDFKFYTFIDEMDYNGQTAWLYKLNLKRRWLFLFLPVVLFLFITGHNYYTKKNKFKSKADEVEKLWKIFFDRTKKKGLSLDRYSLKDQEKAITEFEHQDKETILRVWRDLVQMSFANADASDLKNELRKL